LDRNKKIAVEIRINKDSKETKKVKGRERKIDTKKHKINDGKVGKVRNENERKKKKK